MEYYHVPNISVGMDHFKLHENNNCPATRVDINYLQRALEQLK